MSVWEESGGRVSMIQTHVEADLSEHISVMSANIISLIKENNEITLETLMKKYLRKYSIHCPIQFMDALSFLYSINVLFVENFKVRLRYV